MVTLSELKSGIEERLYKTPADVHISTQGHHCVKIWLPLAHLLSTIPEEGIRFGSKKGLKEISDALGYNYVNRIVLEDLGLIERSKGRYQTTEFAKSADYHV